MTAPINPADAPINMPGFMQKPVTPLEAFQRWIATQNGGTPAAQPALGSGMYATSVNPAYAPDNIDVGGGYNPAGPGGGNSGGWNWLNTRDQQGVAGLAIGGAQALGGLYLGMQQYNLAKESLANNKSQFAQQFAVQKNLTNSNLEDRQRARVASNPGAYQSVAEYMSANGVK